MHVQARIPVLPHSVIVHSRTSLLGPVVHACLFHDHAKCSCVGGPRRLVQSHFTCHSHERSSRFFVMLMYRTYTSIRGTYKHQSLLHPAQHVPCLLSSVSCCSSVSVSAPTFGTDVLPQVTVAFPYETSHNKVFLSRSTSDIRRMAY